MIRTPLPAALAALLLSSCVVAIEAEEQRDPAMEHAASGPAVADEGPAAVAEAGESAGPEELDLAALEAAAKDARGALEKAGLDNRIALIEADSRLDGARLDLDAAVAELEHFEAVVVPRELEQKRLSMDRSEGRLLEARAELQQLIDMYEGEEFATSSKELVLERGRRSVAFSERSLALAAGELADHETFVLARRHEGLGRGVDKARLAVELAELRREAAGLSATLEEDRLGRKLDDAEEALREAREAIEAGEAVAKG